MARPGQAAARKRKATRAGGQDRSLDAAADDRGEDGSDNGGENEQEYKGSQVLPVAVIDDDWDGEVLDGATYLAVANRDNAKLPPSKRVPNPYQRIEMDASAQRAGMNGLNDGNADAGPSKIRHPALPQESWEHLFPIHFVNYKKHILGSWPPRPLPPYPSEQPRIPNVYDRADLMFYINGYPRARIKLHEEEDEEELMNLQIGAGQAGGVGGSKSVYGPEPEGPRHLPREPTVAILSRFSNIDAVAALSKITVVLKQALAAITPTLRIPEQYTSSTDNSSPQGQTPGAGLHASGETADRTGDECANGPNPLPPHLAKWIFALLLIVDTQLTGNDVAVLRDLARAVMRVAAWRWIEGVTRGEVTEGYSLGQTWKDRIDSTATSDGNATCSGPNGLMSGGKDTLGGQRNVNGPTAPTQGRDTSVDETLARCWMIVYAIAAGWGQRDLVQDVVDMFK